jgi:CDP-glucose 4,6-dehydratase
MSKGEQIHVRSPHAQRPWQHVLEPLRGYLLLAERLLKADGKKYASGWNFGPNDDDAIEVAGLVEKLTSLWGDGAASTTDNGPKAHEAMHLKLDSSRARALLGWRPILNVDKSLQWTVDWHKAHASANEMRQFTIAQVERFSAST